MLHWGSRLIGPSSNFKEKGETCQTARQIVRPRRKTTIPQLRDPNSESAVVDRAVNVVVCVGSVRDHLGAGQGRKHSPSNRNYYHSDEEDGLNIDVLHQIYYRNHIQDINYQ